MLIGWGNLSKFELATDTGRFTSLQFGKSEAYTNFHFDSVLVGVGNI